MPTHYRRRAVRRLDGSASSSAAGPSAAGASAVGASPSSSIPPATSPTTRLQPIDEVDQPDRPAQPEEDDSGHRDTEGRRYVEPVGTVRYYIYRLFIIY